MMSGFLIVLIAAGLLVAGPSVWAKYQAKVAFDATELPRTSLQDAISKSVVSGKPILVEMQADWCRYCVKFHREVLADDRVKDYILENYEFALLDYDNPDHKGYKNRFGITTIPAVVALDTTGDFKRKIEIRYNPDEFLSSLSSGL